MTDQNQPSHDQPGQIAVERLGAGVAELHVPEPSSDVETALLRLGMALPIVGLVIVGVAWYGASGNGLRGGPDPLPDIGRSRRPRCVADRTRTVPAVLTHPSSAIRRRPDGRRAAVPGRPDGRRDRPVGAGDRSGVARCRRGSPHTVGVTTFAGSHSSTRFRGRPGSAQAHPGPRRSPCCARPCPARHRRPPTSRRPVGPRRTG